MHHLKSEKILDFVANVRRLSQIQADGDNVCELPVMKGGQPAYPRMLLISVVCVAYMNCYVGT